MTFKFNPSDSSNVMLVGQHFSPFYESISILSGSCMSYNPKSSPYHVYHLRGLKNQMRIRITCGLNWWLRAGFWKNDRATVHALRTVQYKFFSSLVSFLKEHEDCIISFRKSSFLGSIELLSSHLTLADHFLVFPPQSNVAFINSKNLHCLCSFPSPLHIRLHI
jgi:hypothetical protein